MLPANTPPPVGPIPSTLSSHVCIDFVNSRFADHLGSGDWHERLTMTAWQRWFAERCGVAAPPAPGRGVRGQLEELRHRLRELLMTGRRPTRADLAYLNGILGRQLRSAELTVARGTYELREHRRLDGWPAIMAVVVESYADILVETLGDDVRVCANPSCSWLFLDDSPGGRRRWCDVAVCGNLMRVRKFRRSLEAG